MAAATFLIVFGFIALMAAAIVLVLLHEKKRREAFQAQAARLGLSYEPTSTESLPQRYAQFGVFNQGFDRRALHVLRGSYRGTEVRLFEFRYKTRTRNGKTTQTRTHHVGVALADLGQTLARTKIVPENLGHKLFDALGGDDIDFESDEFSRKFWVKGDDRRAAYDLVHARMMEFLLTPGWNRWEIVTPGVCLWEPGRLDPRQVQPVLDRLVGFVGHMPKHGARAPIAVGVRA